MSDERIPELLELIDESIDSKLINFINIKDDDIIAMYKKLEKEFGTTRNIKVYYRFKQYVIEVSLTEHYNICFYKKDYNTKRYYYNLDVLINYNIFRDFVLSLGFVDHEFIKLYYYKAETEESNFMIARIKDGLIAFAINGGDLTYFDTIYELINYLKIFFRIDQKVAICE